jgi:hypothetical protein
MAIPDSEPMAHRAGEFDRRYVECEDGHVDVFESLAILATARKMSSQSSQFVMKCADTTKPD